MTICIKCQVEFEIAAHLKRQDDYRCDACKAAYNREWRLANPAKYKLLLAKHKPSAAAHQRQYRHRMGDPEKRKKLLTRHTLRRAVAQGKVQRLPCDICGSPKVEGHHDDYSKPLEVRWLCPPHHRQIHREMQS